MRPYSMIEFYRRYQPKLSVSRLVDGLSPSSDPRYIGFRINLWFWSIEVTFND